ncbi:MAG: RNA polymerase sigma factor [Bacteroidales bacterium]|nr:RNA polymerase sigma factor [Bacteroidales bacterium]
MNSKDKHYKEIIEENQARIRSVCRYYAGASQDSEDLYQEILINIWRGLEKFRGESQLSTWVYRIAVNTALTFVNKKNKYLNFNTYLDDGKAASLMGDDAEAKVSEDKKLDLMADLINELSVVDKIIMSLVLEELSTKEIAEIVGITETNVRVKIHRIKEELREKVKGGQYDI